MPIDRRTVDAIASAAKVDRRTVLCALALGLDAVRPLARERLRPEFERLGIVGVPVATLGEMQLAPTGTDRRM